MAAPDEIQLLDRVLAALERSRVIRNQDATYELTHDFLAHKIASTFTDEERRVNDAKKILRERFASYQLTKSLLTKEELKLIKPRVKLLDATAQQEKLIRLSSARLNWFYTGVGLVTATLLVVIGVGIYLFVQKQKSDATTEREIDERKKFALLADAKNHFVIAETFFAAYSKGVSSPTLVNDMVEDIERGGDLDSRRVSSRSNDESHKATDTDHQEKLLTAGTFRSLNTDPSNFRAILDSAEVNYEKAWRLDNTLFSALIGLVKVRVSKNKYQEALEIFRSETDSMKWELKNVVFFQTLQTMEFGRDTAIVRHRMDFLYDLFHELYMNQQTGSEQLTYAAVRLLDLSYQHHYHAKPERLANLIAGIEQSIDKAPDPDLLLVLGSHFLRDGSADTSRAIKHFDKIDDKPMDTLRRFRTSRDLNLIASVLLQSGNRRHQQKAVEYLKSSLKFDGRSQKTLVLLGQYYYDNDEYQLALSNFRKAASIKPDKDIYHDLGLTSEQLNDPHGATGYYLKALDHQLENEDYFNHLASIYYDNAEYESAIIAYDAVLSMEPEKQKALHFKTKSLEALERYEEAYEMSLKLRELWPDNIHYEAYHYASNARKMALVKPSRKHHYQRLSRAGYRRAIALAEASDTIRLPALYNDLAIVLAADSIDLDEALLLSNQSIALASHEDKGRYMYTLSRVYAKKGSPLATMYRNTAIANAEKKNDSTLLELIGEQEFGYRNYEASLNVWEKILNKDPNNLHALHYKGKNLELMGNSEQAIESFEQLIRRSPDDLHVLDEHLSALYFQVGDTLQGIKTSEKVTNLLHSGLNYLVQQSNGKVTEDITEKKLQISRHYNNLAWNMALSNTALERALHYSEKSLEYCQLAQDRGNFLDTKAEIYLRMKKFDDARKVNDEAKKYAGEQTMIGINEREEKILKRMNN